MRVNLLYIGWGIRFFLLVLATWLYIDRYEAENPISREQTGYLLAWLGSLINFGRD